MKNFETLPLRQRIERWENVLRVLKGLTPHQRRKHWSMRFYVKQTECGTIACAAGHCGLDPWFRRLRFKLTTDVGMGEVTLNFFGRRGSEEIFWDVRDRPVGEVIREVKAYLKELRHGAGSH